MRCIVVSGAGPRGFCAGGDIKHVAALAAEGEEHDGLPRRGEAGDEVVLGVRSARRAQRAWDPLHATHPPILRCPVHAHAQNGRVSCALISVRPMC